MNQVIRNLKANTTPEEFRNEMFAGVAFLVACPILFIAFWIITPA